MSSEEQDTSRSAGSDTVRNDQETVAQIALIREEAFRSVAAEREQTRRATTISSFAVAAAIGTTFATAANYYSSEGITQRQQDELDQCQADLRVKPTYYYPVTVTETVTAGTTTTLDGPTATEVITITETPSAYGHAQGNNSATSTSQGTQL